MTKVAIIGCGPSGMFFLHAIALRRKQFEKEGNSTALAALPDVTCFEQSSSPGGLWKSDRSNNKDNNGNDGNNGEQQQQQQPANMYEALWTNNPKECFEFFDYTFDEHFGCALPTYMPRQLILEYMLARCTKDNPTLFEDVKFNTSVTAVNYNEELRKFIVQTMAVDQETESVTETTIFDKCIWAAGENGKLVIPQTISNVLSSGGFKGRVMHSSENGADFDICVRGKKILIIGDSYSAEDLTLTSIKLGVETVDLCSRSGNGITYDTGCWPEDKVDVHRAYMPTGVTDDGCGIILNNGTKDMIMEDIATVIYCTGYSKNMDMLHPSLRPASEGPYFKSAISRDWKMPKNALSNEFGDIPIGKILQPWFENHDLYRGRLMSNPNMMFFVDRLENPLADIEVQAWLLLAQITGDIPLPSPTEMKQFNLDTLLEGMKDPFFRCRDEENYKKRWDSVAHDHWSCDFSDERMKQMSESYGDLEFRILARDMVDAKYPLHIGTYNKLNEKGKALVAFDTISGYDRYDLNEESPDSSWRTFRDCDPSKYYSIMTGTKAVSLKCKWLELDGTSVENIVDGMVKVEKVRSVTGMIRESSGCIEV